MCHHRPQPSPGSAAHRAGATLPPVGRMLSHLCLSPSLPPNSQRGVLQWREAPTVLWDGGRRKGRGQQQESSPPKEKSNLLASTCPRELRPLQQLPWGSTAAHLGSKCRLPVSVPVHTSSLPTCPGQHQASGSAMPELHPAVPPALRLGVRPPRRDTRLLQWTKGLRQTGGSCWQQTPVMADGDVRPKGVH